MCTDESVDNCKIRTEKYYRTRILTNSRLKQANVQSLMAMSKNKAVEMYSKTCRSVVTTRTSCKDFAQDGRQAGRASDKADTQYIATGSGFIADDTERGHIDSPICPDSIEKHAVHSHKVVADEMLDDSVNKKCEFMTLMD